MIGPIKHYHLRKLRLILSNYFDKDQAKEIVDDAGINSSAISFDGSARNAWRNILNRAKTEGKLQTIVDVAHENLPGNNELTVLKNYDWTNYSKSYLPTGGIVDGGSSSPSNPLLKWIGGIVFAVFTGLIVAFIQEWITVYKIKGWFAGDRITCVFVYHENESGQEIKLIGANVNYMGQNKRTDKNGKFCFRTDNRVTDASNIKTTFNGYEDSDKTLSPGQEEFPIKLKEK